MDWTPGALLRGMKRIEVDHRRPSPPASDGFVQDNSREPGSQAGGPAKIAQAGERPDQGFLHRVFRLLVVRQYAPRDPIEMLVMAADQHVERSGIALPGAFKQFAVAGSRHVRSLSCDACAAPLSGSTIFRIHQRQLER